MKKLVFVPILFSIYLISGQTRQLDKVNLLFEQGNYRIVERKCKKILKKEKAAKQYENQYKIYLHLTSYMLDNELNTQKIIFSTKEIINLLKDDNINTSIDYISLGKFKQKIEKDIIKLKSKQQENSAKELYENYCYFFKLKKLNYEELEKKENEKPEEYISKESSSLVNYAKSYLGIPYLYGGTTKKGFDCSGFTREVFLNYGYTIPRTAKDQSIFTRKVKVKNIKSGDLLFFGKNDKNISHVGIAIKNKSEELKMIHSSSSNGIIISKVMSNTYWAPKFRFAGRVID